MNARLKKPQHHLIWKKKKQPSQKNPDNRLILSKRVFDGRYDTEKRRDLRSCKAYWPKTLQSVQQRIRVRRISDDVPSRRPKDPTKTQTDNQRCCTPSRRSHQLRNIFVQAPRIFGSLRGLPEPHRLLSHFVAEAEIQKRTFRIQRWKRAPSGSR